MSQTNIAEGLVAVLRDFTADLSERDDAAMDLGESDDKKGLMALYQVAKDYTEDEILVASCGESIAQIWLRRGYCEEGILEKLHPTARLEIFSLISSKNKSILPINK